jgi:DNA-binding transcriptional ArsR family regulator
MELEHNAVMQKDRIRLTNPEAVRTLRDTPVLRYFVHERNASDVATELEMPANLVHHHVKRALELGLMVETKREGKRIYYQLTAKEYRYGRDLLGMDERITSSVNAVSSSFLEAYTAFEAHSVEANDPDFHAFGFVEPESLPPPPPLPERPKDQDMPPYPPHFQVLTVRLTPAQYLETMHTLTRMVKRAESQRTNDASPCTVALLGYGGTLRNGSDNGEDISSWIGEPKP